MHKAHISVSCINLLCLFFLLVAITLPEFQIAKNLLVLGVFGGYFVNLITVFISLCLVIFYIYRWLNGTQSDFITKHWLGVFNGLFIVGFWALAMVVGNMPSGVIE